MSDWKSYKRYPIRIGTQTIILLHIFRNEGHISDIWAWELEDEAKYKEVKGNLYEMAASQFTKQLEGHDCIAFWQALRAEAERHITEWEKMCKEIENET